jgi:hypothetical protein
MLQCHRRSHGQVRAFALVDYTVVAGEGQHAAQGGHLLKQLLKIAGQGHYRRVGLAGVAGGEQGGFAATQGAGRVADAAFPMLLNCFAPITDTGMATSARLFSVRVAVTTTSSSRWRRSVSAGTEVSALCARAGQPAEPAAARKKKKLEKAEQLFRHVLSSGKSMSAA